MAETIEMNGTQVQFVDPGENLDIIPVENDGDLEEITPAQMAVGLGLTMAVGYGIGKLGELAWRKAIGPLCSKLGRKFEEQQAKRRAAKKEDAVEPVKGNGDSGEEPDKYEKASEEIRKNNYKKNK